MVDNKNPDCFICRSLNIALFKRCNFCSLPGLHSCPGFLIFVSFIILSIGLIAVAFTQKQQLVQITVIVFCLIMLVELFIVNSKWNALVIHQKTLQDKNAKLENDVQNKSQNINEIKSLFAETIGKMENELEVLAKIQRSLLPEKLPNFKNTKIAIHYQPSTQAGGDYYDFIDISPGVMGVVIADVSGHGAAAAVAMAITRVLMKGFAPAFQSPGKALARINLLMHRLFPTEQFVTMFYGIYDYEKAIFKYSSAGHPMPYKITAGTNQVVELDDVGSLPLKIFEEVEYPEKTIELSSGDKILLYTDGLTDALDEKDEIFGYERLTSLLEKYNYKSSYSIDDLKNHIITGLNDFVKGKPFSDDFTMVLLETSFMDIDE